MIDFGIDPSPINIPYDILNKDTTTLLQNDAMVLFSTILRNAFEWLTRCYIKKGHDRIDVFHFEPMYILYMILHDVWSHSKRKYYIIWDRGLIMVPGMSLHFWQVYTK